MKTMTIIIITVCTSAKMGQSMEQTINNCIIIVNVSVGRIIEGYDGSRLVIQATM